MESRHAGGPCQPEGQEQDNQPRGRETSYRAGEEGMSALFAFGYALTEVRAGTLLLSSSPTFSTVFCERAVQAFSNNLPVFGRQKESTCTRRLGMFWRSFRTASHDPLRQKRHNAWDKSGCITLHVCFVCGATPFTLFILAQGLSPSSFPLEASSTHPSTPFTAQVCQLTYVVLTFESV